MFVCCHIPTQAQASDSSPHPLSPPSRPPRSLSHVTVSRHSPSRLCKVGGPVQRVLCPPPPPTPVPGGLLWTRLLLRKRSCAPTRPLHPWPPLWTGSPCCVGTERRTVRVHRSFTDPTLPALLPPNCFLVHCTHAGTRVGVSPPPPLQLRFEVLHVPVSPHM
jgi:hypothetical protein